MRSSYGMFVYKEVTLAVTKSELVASGGSI